MSESNPSETIEPLIPGQSDPSKDIFVVPSKLSPSPVPAPAIVVEETPEPDAPTPMPEEKKSEVELLHEEVGRLGASLKATQEDIVRLRDEYFQKLKEADQRNAELQRENEQLKQELAAAKQIPIRTNLPEVENPEEPELQMDDAVLEKVETRNPLQRIHDGVANGLRAWWDNIDPRKIGEKDRIWKVGLAIGAVEGAAVNLAPIPGGRFAINAINFLVGQGFYAGGEMLRQAEVASTNKTFEGNEAVQRILDVNDRYINASRNIRNCLFGVSAGITYTSVGGMLWGIGENVASAVQHLANPTQAAEILAGKATGQIGKEALNSQPFGTVTIPDHGNFWNAWHIDSTNWADLHNGTKHTDVIKDMVVKLARHNGHELGLVHAGDQIELSKVLTSEQLELVKKAAAAKSYAEYSQAIRPAYHVLLKK